MNLHRLLRERETDGNPVRVGLASGVTLNRSVAAGECVRWRDVDIDESSPAVAVRRELEVTIAGARVA